MAVTLFKQVNCDKMLMNWKEGSNLNFERTICNFY